MPPHVPNSTYRLQLSAEFGFDDAAKLVPYLKEIGISHLYTSPILKARAGSKHGYDIVDHGTLNPEYGGAAGFERLCAALKQEGLSLLVDFVPNHMGVGHSDNAWWLDVLEWGQESPHAKSFDIDWDALPYRRAGVLVPILGRPYADALESGELELKYDAAEGTFSVWYFDHRLPISPSRYSAVLSTVVEAAKAGREPTGQALLDIAAVYRHAKDFSRDEAAALKNRLRTLPAAPPVIERGLSAYNAKTRRGLARLHGLLERQHYLVAYWRVAVASINYRRFFDISDLAGIRVEDDDTFDAVHRYIGELIAKGCIQGLRLDHIDGLWDPKGYSHCLRNLIRQKAGSDESFYVVVEKILGEGEAAPALEGVDGTTGYEWLNVISRVLLDSRGLGRLNELWREIAGTKPFKAVVEEAKRYVLGAMLASEFNVLAQLLARIAIGHYSTRDYAAGRLRAALQMFVLEFPVYRTYLETERIDPVDRATIEGAIASARERWLGPDPEIFDFLRDALTLDLVRKSHSGYSKSRVLRFARKLQQFTGPVMAKSLEDTAFYRYGRLLALNEVGGDPMSGELAVADFHALMAARAVQSPHGLTTTATHDTKRGEDARARILALSDVAEEWAVAMGTWRQMNARFVEHQGSKRMPSGLHEYMLYQSLIGAWTLDGVDHSFVERFTDYAIKAARESKQNTNWAYPDESYEQALTSFVHRILDRGESAPFLDSFDVFARRVSLLGVLNSLSQLVLKATMPGVPDFYQGVEFWDLSLVDPDNRRPVDFVLREQALARLDARPNWLALAETWPHGRIKLALTHELLRLRNAMPEVFRDGGYRPVEVRGADRDHVVAFTRQHAGQAVIVAVGRHFSDCTGSGRYWPSQPWDAVLNLDEYRDLHHVLHRSPLAGAGNLAISALFGAVPVAVLTAHCDKA